MAPLAAAAKPRQSPDRRDRREVHDAAVPRVVKLGRIESLGNIWRDQEVWPEGHAVVTGVAPGGLRYE